MCRIGRKITSLRLKPLICFLVFCVTIKGYTQDSLKKNTNLPNYKLTQQEKRLLEKINAESTNKNFVFDDTQIDLFRNDFKNIKELYKKIKNKDTKTEVLLAFYLGNLYYFLFEDYYTTGQYLDYVYQHEEVLNNAQKISLYNILADCENTKSNFVNSIFFYNKSLELSKKTNNAFEIYRTNREIGARYRDLGNYKLAEKYLLQAKKLQEEQNIQGADPLWLLMHLAHLKYKLKDYSSAQYFINKALTHENLKNAPRTKGYLYIEKAKIWKALSKPDSAKAYLNKIISETELYNKDLNFEEKYDKIIQIYAYNILGDTALQENDTVSAIYNYTKAFDIGTSINESRETLIASKNLLKLNKNDKLLQLKTLDYINNVYKRNNQLINVDLIANKAKEKEQKSVALEDITEIDYYQVIALSFIGVCVIIFAITFYYLLKRNQIITNRKELIYAQNSSMNSTNVMLKNTNKDLDQFSNIVSTDIKQSLNIIDKKIKQLFNSQKSITEFKNLKEESSKLNLLITELLETTKNTKENKISPENIDFEDVIETVKQSLKNHITLLNPKITYNQNMPKFYGYRIQIYQLFKNMIENALKYSNPAKQPTINITITKQNNIASISIADNGIGIPKEKQTEIFELFSQSRAVDMSKGMGIGLNICKKITSDYDGSISVESEEGNGCTFKIKLKEIKH